MAQRGRLHQPEPRQRQLRQRKEHQRHDDMVWRLKVGQQWVWVYLLLEFQSKPDPWMALRIMVYLGLLSQHLVNEGELQNGLLPPIVPIVLYNGTPQWPHPRT
ncbi:MAG: Rpn family recombination-promoting nuclease/putative transposase [Burkholderiales bacterium]|nr:Rpn family recombination-promoting nuclease/putative transposase [Burkholderiales bacterium]